MLLVANSASDARLLVQQINDSKRLAAVAGHIEREFRGSQAKLAQVTRVVLILVITLWLIGMFATSTNLHASLITRLPELASLIALGVRRNRVAALVMMESLVLSLVGGVLAIALMMLVNGRSSAMFHASAMFKLQIGLVPIAVGAGLAILVGLIGGAVPTFIVRRIDLVQGLR